MTAHCPSCDHADCNVRECYRQATRYEPRRFLGLSGYCPSCNLGFRVETPQLELTTAGKGK